MKTFRPSPRSAARSGLVLGLLLAAACSSPTDEGEAPTVGSLVEAREVGGVHMLTQVRDLNAYPEALYEGPVTLDGAGCLRLDGSQTTVLWPPGWSVRVGGAGTVLVDADGTAVGAVGDRFRMAGGHVPFLHEGLGFGPEDQTLAVSRCPGDFWLATPGTVERR